MVWTYWKKDINKRWQEYTEELYKKDIHDPENHDGVIALLEPDILLIHCRVYNSTANKVEKFQLS